MAKYVCKSRNFRTKGKPPWMDIEKESLMLTSLLLCICVRHFFILRHLCSTFILRFPLWTILIISWFPTLCSGWLLSSSLVICTHIWNSIINKRRNKMNNSRIVGVVCVYSYPVIVVRVLHLCDNNSSRYILYWFIAETILVSTICHIQK